MKNRQIDTQLIEMVKEKLLLERISLHGVDVNQKDEYGNNALFWAIKVGSTYNANLLISFGSKLMVNSHQHALFHAIESQQHAMVVLLLEKGLDVNMTDESGKTLLMYAIEAEQFETVRYLLQKGADLYLFDDRLKMAQDYAIASKNEMVISYMEHMMYQEEQTSRVSSHSCGCK